MPYTKEHIRVFLAYISDVEPEVNVVKDIVESINHSHESLGTDLDLITWKDVPEEFGNPQEKINPLVDKCDVFVGLIWKKWGTPTGQSDCGFKEEFEIAEKRYNETRQPTILLYAKTVNEQEIGDGEKESFKRVKEFKDEIVNKQKGFLKSFDTTDQWKEIIRGRLTQYVVDKHVSVSKGSTVPQNSQAVSAGEQYGVIEKVKTPKEIQTLIGNLTSYKSKIDEIIKIGDFEKIRLFLLSSAIFYDTNLYEILGNHEIHLLYLRKTDIKPIGLETKLIFRTLIANRYDIKTGWFWLRHAKDKKLKDYVSSYLINDVNKEVRYGAITFLDKFWLKRYKQQLLSKISDTEDEIKIKAFEISTIRGDESYLNTIDGYLSDPNKEVAEAAWTAKFAILSRIHPDLAIGFLLKFKTDRGTYKPYLNQIKKSISEANLRELVSDSDSDIKLFAYEQLLKNGQISHDEIRTLWDNQSIELKKFAYLSLIDLGEKFNAKNIRERWPYEQRGPLLGGHWHYNEQRESVIEKIYENSSKEELWNEIDWNSVTGHIAYRCYGLKYYESFKELLYKDLDTDFKRIKDAFVKKFESAIKGIINDNKSEDSHLSNILTVPVSMDERLPQIDKHVGFTRKQFIVSALSILISKGVSEALVYARKYATLEDADIKNCVVQIIANHGTLEDVPALLKIAFDSYGSTKIEATKQALIYSNFNKEIIQQFISSGDKDIVKACLSYGLAIKENSVLENAKDLLMHKTEDIRIYALSYLANKLSKEKLPELLNNYLAGTTYYYNVVCWLDRILFAPSKIRSFYKKYLLNKIKENE